MNLPELMHYVRTSRARAFGEGATAPQAITLPAAEYDDILIEAPEWELGYFRDADRFGVFKPGETHITVEARTKRVYLGDKLPYPNDPKCNCESCHNKWITSLLPLRSR